jgi:23S rRNA (adenine2030-N6)-methyltransferase
VNYRHHFHAGNFADVMKHAVLLALIPAMRAGGPVRFVETHAGAGLYDLEGELARRTREAEAGVGRLMAAEGLPASLEALRRAVARENGGQDLRLYPGSPLVALAALTRGERYVGCELRPDDFQTLAALLAERADGVRAEAVEANGYTALEGLVSGGELVLIDPPFERADDYALAADAVALCLARKASVAVWAPIKDLETLDALVRRIEALSPARVLVAETRLRPLVDPMRMNGSAMLLVDTPDVFAEVAAVCDWVAAHCGEAGAKGMAAVLES